MTQCTRFSKRDAVVLVLCIGLALLCLGSVGGSGRTRAREAVCRSNLHQWGVMFDRYTNEHDGNFNPGWDVGPTELWMNALRPYYRDEHRLLLCPAATRLPGSGQWWGAFAAWSRVLDLPGGGQYPYVGSYSINSWTNNMTTSRGADRQVDWFWKTVRDVRDPNTVPVFADSTWHDAWPRHTDPPAPYSVDDIPGSMWATGEMNHFCIDRHAGGVNFLFMDWSVRKVGLKELWTLRWHRVYNTEGPWTRAGGVLPIDWPQWMRQFKEY